MHDHVVDGDAEHLRNLAAQCLRILIVRVDVHHAVRPHVANGHGRPDRRVLHVRHLVGGGKLLLRGCKRGGRVALGRAALHHRRRFPVGLVPQALVELCAARQSLPIRPLGVAGDLLRGLDRFPFGGRDHADEVLLHDDLRIGIFRLVELASGDQRGAKCFRMHHASVQHSGQAHIGRPIRLGRHLRPNGGARERLADDRVLAHRLHRRIAFDAQAHDARQISLDGNRQVQLLALDEVAVRDALAPAGDHAVLDGELVFWHAQLRRREIKQCLVGVGGHLAKIRRTVVQEAERAAAVGRLVGASGNDGGDRLEGHRQFFGHDLPVGRVDRALAEVVLAGADRHRVVRVDFEPGTGEGRIEGVLGDRSLRRIAPKAGRANYADADGKYAACLHELAAGESRAKHIDRLGSLGRHRLPPLRHDRGSMLHGLDDRLICSAAAQNRRYAGRRVSRFDLLQCRIRIAFEQFRRLDHHSVLAESALRSLFLDPGLLDGVKCVLRFFRREALLLCPPRQAGLRAW